VVNAILTALSVFGLRPFKAREFAEKLGYSQGYVKNLISKAVASGEVVSHVSVDDKRVKIYRINPAVIKDAIMRGGKEKEGIIESLGLKGKYSGGYVALLEGGVVDYDEDLYALSDRVFAEHPAEEIIVTNVGIPRKMITLEL